MKSKSIAEASRKWRRPLWLMLPILVVGLLAHRLWPSGLDSETDRDGELITRQILGSRISPKEVRAQIGEERFWRAIKSGIIGRPSDLETRLRDWMDDNGSRPRVWQEAIDTVRRQLEKGWGKREERFSEMVMIIRLDDEHVAIPVLPEVMTLVESGQPSRAQTGVDMLTDLKEGAVEALPVLFRRWERSGNELGTRIVWAVSEIDPQGVRSAKWMVDLLPGASDSTRIVVLPVIGSFAARDPELATNLWTALAGDYEVAGAAILGLQQAGQLTAERLEPFRKGFQADSFKDRWLSLHLVAASGTVAGGFVPELRQAGLHESLAQGVALAALHAVLLAPEAQQSRGRRLAAAEALLASDNAKAGWAALGELQWLGFGEPDVLALVTQALTDSSAQVRVRAVELLGRLGPAARPALPHLQALRNDEWKMVRDAVEIALPKIGE